MGWVDEFFFIEQAARGRLPIRGGEEARSALAFALEGDGRGKVVVAAPTPLEQDALPMRPFHAFLLLVLATSLGGVAKADSPEDPTPAPTVEPRRFLGVFRRHESAPRPAAIPPARLHVPPPAHAGQDDPQPGTQPLAPAATPPRGDVPVRRAQAAPGEMSMPLGLGSVTDPALPPLPAGIASGGGAGIGTQSLSLEAALYGALTGNPDLVSLRQGNVPGNAASPEAVEVARRFPTTMNPTLWVDVRPIDLIPTVGGIAPSNRASPVTYKQGDVLMYFSIRQPLELGHQRRYRYAAAKAALTQQRWTVVQAELLALVQTYRFFETAAYRREKLRVAGDLARFNDQLVETLKRRLEAGQVTPDTVTLAEVESEATRQLAKAAKQDYARALTDLRNQLGTPEQAGTAEPLGEFILPQFIPQVEDDALIQMALQNRPEIHAARAQVEVARAAAGLARADRIPTPVVGPIYERDETATEFVGFVYITPIPIINNGTPLVRQREAEFRRACVALEQVQQRTIAQVEAAISNWNEANLLSRETQGLTEKLKEKVASMERLFEAGQTDLTRLLQARQRLIQLENAELDAIWQATQAQADLLTALGAPTLIQALNRAEQQNDPPGFLPASLPPDSPATESPFRRQ